MDPPGKGLYLRLIPWTESSINFASVVCEELGSQRAVMALTPYSSETAASISWRSFFVVVLRLIKSSGTCGLYGSF